MTPKGLKNVNDKEANIWSGVPEKTRNQDQTSHWTAWLAVTRLLILLCSFLVSNHHTTLHNYPETTNYIFTAVETSNLAQIYNLCQQRLERYPPVSLEVNSVRRFIESGFLFLIVILDV
jgi:hypothetical protein